MFSFVLLKKIRWKRSRHPFWRRLSRAASVEPAILQPNRSHGRRGIFLSKGFRYLEQTHSRKAIFAELLHNTLDKALLNHVSLACHLSCDGLSFCSRHVCWLNNFGVRLLGARHKERCMASPTIQRCWHFAQLASNKSVADSYLVVDFILLCWISLNF